jgi:hypothetical protein
MFTCQNLQIILKLLSGEGKVLLKETMSNLALPLHVVDESTLSTVSI